MAGWIAIAAAAVAVLGIAIAFWLHLRLRRVRAAQQTLLGSGGGDLVDFAVSLQGRIDGVHRALDDVLVELDPHLVVAPPGTGIMVRKAWMSPSSPSAITTPWDLMMRYAR